MASERLKASDGKDENIKEMKKEKKDNERG